MNTELRLYFKKNEEAFYEINGMKKMRGVHKYYGDTTRNEKAAEQAKLLPIPISKIISYVNDFFYQIAESYNAKFFEMMELEKSKQVIIDSCIVATNLKWDNCVFDKASNKYIYWDPKYDLIRNKFNLKSPSDIIWMKFTNKGHLGVVSRGFDINFDEKISSGILVKEVGEKWDNSFVLIFPLLAELTDKYSCEDLETAVGNYLISKGVPIIDFYSHNN